jgi:uncharacterized protein
MKCVVALALLFLFVTLAANPPRLQPTIEDAWEAIARADAERLRDVLERGLDPNAGLTGLTLLMHAASEGQSGCIGVLIEQGADVARTSDCGATALTWAAHTGNAGSLRRLLDGGADANTRMAQGATPLILAAISGDIEKVATLLAAGADIHARTDGGRTAADGAEDCGHVELANLLREAGSGAKPR